MGLLEKCHNTHLKQRIVSIYSTYVYEFKACPPNTALEEITHKHESNISHERQKEFLQKAVTLNAVKHYKESIDWLSSHQKFKAETVLHPEQALRLQSRQQGKKQTQKVTDSEREEDRATNTHTPCLFTVKHLRGSRASVLLQREKNNFSQMLLFHCSHLSLF